MKEIQEILEKQNRILFALLKEVKELNTNLINNNCIEFPEIAINTEDGKGTEERSIMKIIDEILNEKNNKSRTRNNRR